LAHRTIGAGVKRVAGGVTSERERERETTDYEAFALHAPMQWAIQGYVTPREGVEGDVTLPTWYKV